MTPYIIFTGGEPLLQLDDALIQAVKQYGFEIGLETNGTLPAPTGLDWICVSPKLAAPMAQTSGDELKFVYPQAHLTPDPFANMDFRLFYIQPKAVADEAEARRHRDAATTYCLENPQWRLSLQTHKILDLD